MTWTNMNLIMNFYLFCADMEPRIKVSTFRRNMSTISVNSSTFGFVETA